MPLDETLKQVLESYPHLPEQLTPELIVDIRKARLEAMLNVDKRPSRTYWEDRVIYGPNGSIPIRMYIPKRSIQPLPAIVFFHGGGWTLGSDRNV